MTPSVAFVTKSYGPDLERCELLCRSVELLAPDTRHWIIVDARDHAAFRGLENARTRIVTTEELLPRRVRRFEVYGTDKNIWLGARTPPIRGWLVQQLAKFAIALVAREEVLIHADSDIVLIRPFREELLMDETGALRLFRVPATVGEELPATCAGIGRLSDFWGFRLVHYRCPTTSAAWFRGAGKPRSHCCKRLRRGPAVTGCALSQARETSPSTSSMAASSKTHWPIEGSTRRQPFAVPVLLGLGTAHESRAGELHRRSGAARGFRDGLGEGRNEARGLRRRVSSGAGPRS